MRDTITDLSQRVELLARQQIRYRQGVITNDSPLSVAVGGSDIPYTDVKQIDGVSANIGDSVGVFMFGNDILVLGVITGSASAPGAQNVYVQDTAPTSPPATYLWIETGLGAGDDMTFWVEDGT